MGCNVATCSCATSQEATIELLYNALLSSPSYAQASTSRGQNGLGAVHSWHGSKIWHISLWYTSPLTCQHVQKRSIPPNTPFHNCHGYPLRTALHMCNMHLPCQCQWCKQASALSWYQLLTVYNAVISAKQHNAMHVQVPIQLQCHAMPCLGKWRSTC